MTDSHVVDWAQDAFFKSQVISDAEIAGKILKDADENGRIVPPSRALQECEHESARAPRIL